MSYSLSQAEEQAWEYLEQASAFSLSNAANNEGVSRYSLTKEHKQLCSALVDWMEQAGMRTHMDNAANVIGRYYCDNPNAPVLLLGSHQDTVPNGGKYDGMLGIVVPLLMVKYCAQNAISFPFHIDVIAFSDEEGSRFRSTLLGSKAISGTFDQDMLKARDCEGISLESALENFTCRPSHIADDAYSKTDTLGFIEVHIEQGPVLEKEGLPLGVVSAITGIERHELCINGVAGHAGTVPLTQRNDALLSAAKVIVAVDQELRKDPLLVGVVGRLENHPNGVNVISDKTSISIEIRSPQDAVRLQAREKIKQRIEQVCSEHGVSFTLQQTYEQAAVQCSESLSLYLANAIEKTGQPVRTLFSGAGHDGLAMHHLCPIAMLFVRCYQGISHNPAESITPQDLQLAIQALLYTCQGLAEQ